MTQEDLLRKILNDDIEQFSIQEIFEIFVIIFDAFEKNSRTVESIKSKITKNEWNSFVNGLTISLFASLYALLLCFQNSLLVLYFFDSSMHLSFVQVFRGFIVIIPIQS